MVLVWMHSIAPSLFLLAMNTINLYSPFGQILGRLNNLFDKVWFHTIPTQGLADDFLYVILLVTMEISIKLNGDIYDFFGGILWYLQIRLIIWNLLSDRL